MPFDNAPSPRHEDLKLLAYTLRHPETWPPGFRWNYSIPQNCAMGLASRMGIDHHAGLDPDEHWDVFVMAGGGIFSMRWVTPRRVAKKLEKVLARHEKVYA